MTRIFQGLVRNRGRFWTYRNVPDVGFGPGDLPDAVQADDRGTDRNAVRSRPGQPARPHEHGQRAARRGRSPRSSPDRREAVPGDDLSRCRHKGRGRTASMTVLPVAPAHRLAERAEERRWLVTSLWTEQAVGIIGGEPKCCKS